MTAGQSLVLGLGMCLLFGLVSWLMLSGGTGEVEWPARGRHRDDGRPRWVRWEQGEFVVPARIVSEWARPALEEMRRAAIYDQWRARRADEAPLFARLAAEMGLGYALGVAA